MKNLFAKIFIILILLQGCDSASVPVKKSKTNICHKKGSNTTIKLSILELIKQSKIVLKVVVDCQKEAESWMTFILNNCKVIYA